MFPDEIALLFCFGDSFAPQGLRYSLLLRNRVDEFSPGRGDLQGVEIEPPPGLTVKHPASRRSDLVSKREFTAVNGATQHFPKMTKPLPRHARLVPCPLDARNPHPRWCRRLLSGIARASRPSGLRLARISNAASRFGFSLSALQRRALTANTASADCCRPSARQLSRGKARDFHRLDPPHIRPTGPGGAQLRVLLPPRPPTGRLLCGSCSSGRGFAYSFLPTIPRDNAVAVRLGVPATRAPRGLAPPSHFLVRFRSPVDSAGLGAARRARRTKKKGPEPGAPTLRVDCL